MTEIITEKEKALLAVLCNDELKHTTDELKADKEFIMAAVQTNGDALEYASDELKADKEFVMAMVENVMAGLNHK